MISLTLVVMLKKNLFVYSQKYVDRVFFSNLNGFTRDCAFSFNIIAFSYNFIILVGYLNMK